MAYDREYSCMNCDKKFRAHQELSVGCSHCGTVQLVRAGICSECLQTLMQLAPIRRPYKCPVCNGSGSTIDGQCHPCKGAGIVWDGEG